MGVYKEIAKADGSGITTFYRLSEEKSTVETTSTGTTETMFDYNNTLNKPSINDVALVGNKTLDELGIQPAGDYITEIPEEYITEEELEAKDYATEAFVMEQINNTEHFHREIVDALPLTGKDNILYLVPKKGSDKDIYNEYIWTGVDYEFMGTTAVDLTDYYQKNEVDELLDNKVTKVSGKQLSTNDYTTAEKTKLASLENYDDSELRSKVDALHNYDDTAIKLDIQDLKKNVSTNEIDITSIENELGYKAEVIRLVKNGDWWLCQDAKGNNLTLEMAMNRLGLPRTILLLENLENDGKYYPVEYELQEKYIDIIYKDLDGITHHLNYGYNEYFTNTASGNYIHLEDSINYPYKELSVDGVCEQETTKGSNYFNAYNIPSSNNFVIEDNGKTIKIPIVSSGQGYHYTNASLKQLCPNLNVGDEVYLYFTRNLGTKYNNYIYLDNVTTLWGNGTKQTITQAMLDSNVSMYGNNFQGGETTQCILTDFRIVKEQNTPWEQYTGGQPSPSPDYPQEIKTIKNSLKITSCNKNLFDKDKLEVGKYINGDGEITSYSNYSLSDYIKVKANTRYSYKGISEYSEYGAFYDNNKVLISTFLESTLTNSYVDTPSNARYIRFTLINTNEDIDNFQFEEGTQATPYEQHLETQITANLPEGEFIGKINDTYKDTLKVEYNEEDGQYHLNLHKNIRKVVLNGSENWVDEGGGAPFALDVENLYKNNNMASVMSDYYIGTYWNKNWNNYSYLVSTNNATSSVSRLKFKNVDITSLADFKTWLSTHNTTVYYVLATPYVVDLGVVDMPITYNEVTNLFTDSDLLPTINIEYYTEILENAKDNIIGQDTYLQDEVDTLNDLPTEANKGDIRKVKDTESWYIYDGIKWSSFDKASEVDLSNYLAKDNTVAYKPATDYNPSTKKYVDDSIADIFIPTKTSQLTNDSGFVLKSVNDLTNYYNKSNTYNKAEVNALVSSGGTGNVSSDTINSIMVVDELPEIEVEGVLYLVKEAPEPVVLNLYPSQVENTETNGFTVTFKEQQVIADGSNDNSSVWGWTNHFNMNLEANKTYYLQFTNLSGSFDDSKRISQSDGIVNAVMLSGYDESGGSTNLINSVERTASGIYEKYTFTPTTTYSEYALSMQVKKLNVFTNWTCSIVIAEESV